MPHLGVVFEAIFQESGQAKLAELIEAGGAEGGDEDGYELGICWGKGTGYSSLACLISRLTPKRIFDSSAFGF